MTSNNISVDTQRLMKNLKELGDTGRGKDNRLVRLVASDADKEGRDLLIEWMKELDMIIDIDQVGNIFGTWQTEDNQDKAPVMVGSHIDSVTDAGIYDGCYGVLSGLEVVRELKSNNIKTERPITVAAFTNEEGVRYPPSMMGSLVYAGGMSVDESYNIEGVDGTLFGDELKRIEYIGEKAPGFIKPHAYIEPHIEQGPVLDKEQIQIGAVGNLQGICRHQITIHGTANHAGTTPGDMRQDAMQAAARFMTMVQDYIHKESPSTVATVGTIELEPNAMTIIPSKAIFSLDFREPDKERYEAARQVVSEFMKDVEEKYDVAIETEELVNFDPVEFDDDIVNEIHSSAETRGFTVKHMTSGAGHDAQMMARICPTAMIFVPSRDGISHNPEEFTKEEDLKRGANVLLDTVLNLVD